jgi:hypothetical protein
MVITSFCSCPKIRQSELNTWLSFESASHQLVAQFSVGGYIGPLCSVFGPTDDAAFHERGSLAKNSVPATSDMILPAFKQVNES